MARTSHLVTAFSLPLAVVLCGCEKVVVEWAVQNGVYKTYLRLEASVVRCRGPKADKVSSVLFTLLRESVTCTGDSYI